MSDDGAHFLTVSDRGSFARATIARDGGKISGIVLEEADTIPLTEGRAPSDFFLDAEGLAIGSDGTIYISYEGHHRIWKFSDLSQYAGWTHKWNRFLGLQPNSGFEALAIDAQDRLYAIPERSGKWTRPFPVYRYDGEFWKQTLEIPRSKKFLVVGADFGPDGMLYILEREFYALRGFRSRVRRFSLTESGFDTGETLLETRFGEIGNAEGISLWTDEAGAKMLTLIADDNYSPLQNTLLVEYEIVE